MSISVSCLWLKGNLTCEEGKTVQTSVVAYEHPAGIPARFCAGLIPAIALSRQLAVHGVKSTVRLIDPSPIANYCNGWEISEPQHRGILSEFLTDHGVNFFFDEAEQMTESAIGVLKAVGHELESATDPVIADMVIRIRESGRKHGGELGADNAVLYMAAHPFSWLDMYHPLVWSRQYSPDTCCFVNLMSKPEARFTMIRKHLRNRRPDLTSGINPADCYTTICNTPCYIPLEDEPTFVDLIGKGYRWCHDRYWEIKGKSGNHRRALKDFEALMSFLGQGDAHAPCPKPR